MKRTKIRILTLVMAAILILGVCSMTLASAFTFEVGQVVYVRSFKSILVAQDKVSGDLVVLTPGAGKKVTILEIDDGWALVSMVKTYLAADGSLVEIETLGAIALSDLVKEMPQISGVAVNDPEVEEEFYLCYCTPFCPICEGEGCVESCRCPK